MKKRIMKVLATVLAAVLVLTTVNPLAVSVSAEDTQPVEKTYEYNPADLAVNARWGTTDSVTDGKYTVSFPAQYNQIFYALPAEINPEKIVKVTVETDATEFCIKLADSAKEPVREVFGKTFVTSDDFPKQNGVLVDPIPEMKNISLIGLMSTSTAETVKEISKITITVNLSEDKVVDETPAEDTTVEVEKTIEYNPADLTVNTRWGGQESNEGGKYSVSFPSQYSQIFYDLPADINPEKIVKVTVETDATEFCIKLADSAKEPVREEFGRTAVTVNDIPYKNNAPVDPIPEMKNISLIGLMSTSAAETVKEISKITITVMAPKDKPVEDKPAEEKPNDGVLAAGTYVYKPTDLTVLAKWDASVEEVDGTHKIAYTKQYGQVFYAVPEDIDPARIESVSVDTDATNFSVKLCQKNSSYTEVGVVYGNTKLTLSNVSGDIATAEVIDLMSLLADGTLEKTIKSISITIGEVVVEDPNAPLKGDLTADCFKTDGNSNPIVTQRYSADPGVMVYEDTVYIYSTNDVYEYVGKKLGENTYSKITTINCFSSKDLVNWTDHGAIAVAGKKGGEGVAKWATNSWAPCAAHKTIDGKEKFFLYFADNGSGIGVLTSDSPTGPFVDPLGKQLISSQTPTCSTITWLFDPAVMVDDDGTGYLVFGGGVPAGKAAHPMNARVVKLGADMISLDGDPVVIDAPYLFEDSGINKIGDTYVYSYCSNWNCADGFRSGTIQYMTSDNPMGPYTYQGEIFANPSSFFSDENGNNHHSLFEFKGKYYIAYHARALETLAVGSHPGYRSTQIDEFTVTDGKINTIKGTMKGVAQTTALNPYEVQLATTIYRQKGVEVLGSGTPALTVTAGDFAGVKGAAFESGASEITMVVKASEAMTIDVYTGSENGTKIGTVKVDPTEDFKTFTAELENVSGTTDFYFVYNGSAEVYSWKVSPAKFTLSSLTNAGGWGYTSEAADNGATSITFSKQYQEVRFSVPESVLKSGKLTGIVLDAEGTDKIAVKIYDEAAADPNKPLQVEYRTATVNVKEDIADNVAKFALMSLDEGETTITVNGITFITEAPEAPVTPDEPVTPEEPDKPTALTGTVVYKAEDLEFYYRWKTSTKAANGVMSFPSNYYEYCVALPEAINAEDIESIKVNVKDQTGSLAIKVYNTTSTGDGNLDNTTPCYMNNKGADSYSVAVPEEGVVAAFGFMSHADDAPFEATVTSIEIKVKTKSIVLGSDELSNLVNPWNGSDVQGPGLTFKSRYQEYGYTLSQAISTDLIESVVVKVKDQGGNICVKFYDEANTEWFHNYGVDGNTEYTFVPEEGKEIARIAFMSMLDPDVEGNYPYGITIESVTINLKAGASAGNKNEEVIEFSGDSLKFVHHAEDETVVDGVISFAQKWDEYCLDFGKELNMERCKSITVNVKGQNGIVSYKLRDKDDEEAQQWYEKTGKQVLTPSCDKAVKLSVMAHDDNAEYPFTITIDSVVIVMDTSEYEEVEKGVEYDIVDLRDAVAQTMGDDFLIGTAASYSEFADSMEMELVYKHFNAVTLGNELKPDTILGSGNNNLQKVTLNGVTFDFPTLNYSTPEDRLDRFVKWNEENPDKKIKVRGHVLVWHSQTPTWFFREGYKSNGAYVSPEEMNLRLEYYIKSVCEHFTGEGSKYRDLFYGWDVVNEAVSDGTGTYRNANENSEWWAVYKSEQFINNAFVYANRYMKKDVELYYNDYNDTVSNKVKGIVKLLENVKATPGARIDGMGMQAHYDMNSPSTSAFMDAARKYAAVVDSVQVTELDFKGSSSSTDERLAKRYEDIYNAIRTLRKEGVNFTAMTIWGVTDKHSWLQTSNSVGGAASGNTRQYPLLFDNNYKAKNSFWAIVNAGELMPEIKSVVLVKSVDDKFAAGKEYTFKKNDEVVTFIPEWSEDGISVKVTVPDTSADSADKVTLYVYDGASIKPIVAERSAATVADENGYTVSFNVEVDVDVIKNNKVKLDVVVTDGEKSYAFNDTRLKQASSSDYYATTVIKAAEIVDKGTVLVDGKGDDADWAKATEIVLAINNGAKANATAKVLWDENNLYILATVKDAVLNADASNAHEKDSIEVFIDENNHKSNSYEDDDKQYRVNYLNEQTYNGTKCTAENAVSAVTVTEDGYVIEAAFKWTDINAQSGTSIGFDIQVNDAEAGARIGTLNWADTTGTGYSSPSVFGNIVLKDSVNDKEPEVTPGEGDKEPEVTPGEDDNKDPEVTPGEDDNKDPEEDNKEEDKKDEETPAPSYPTNNTPSNQTPATQTPETQAPVAQAPATQTQVATTVTRPAVTVTTPATETTTTETEEVVETTEEKEEVVEVKEEEAPKAETPSEEPEAVEDKAVDVKEEVTPLAPQVKEEKNHTGIAIGATVAAVAILSIAGSSVLLKKKKED